MNEIQRMEKERKTLRILSVLFLILAAIEAVNMIIFFVSGELNVAEIAAEAQVAESIMLISLIVIIAISVLSLLVEVYLGVMGLRQCAGKKTGTSHITLAKVCVAFLVVGLVIALVNIVTAPNKDWVDLCSSLASVAIGMTYIRAAQYVRA